MQSIKTVSRQEIQTIRKEVTHCIRTLQGTGSFQLNEIVNDLNRLRILLADMHQNGTVVQPLTKRILTQIQRTAPKVDDTKRQALIGIVAHLKVLI